MLLSCTEVIFVCAGGYFKLCSQFSTAPFLEYFATHCYVSQWPPDMWRVYIRLSMYGSLISSISLLSFLTSQPFTPTGRQSWSSKTIMFPLAISILYHHFQLKSHDIFTFYSKSSPDIPVSKVSCPGLVTLHSCQLSQSQKTLFDSTHMKVQNREFNKDIKQINGCLGLGGDWNMERWCGVIVERQSFFSEVIKILKNCGDSCTFL